MANKAPVVSGPTNLGEIAEDGSIHITAAQLLSNASDADGDSLSIVDLKLSTGEGSISDNGDGSWSFTPTKDWSGDVSFTYQVSDTKTISVTSTPNARPFSYPGKSSHESLNKTSFAAIRSDGSVVIWGDSGYDADSSDVEYALAMSEQSNQVVVVRGNSLYATASR